MSSTDAPMEGRVYAWEEENDDGVEDPEIAKIRAELGEQARALLGSPNDSPEKRTYAWERNNEAEDAEIAALKAELDEQEKLLDEHQQNVSGGEAHLETMIKDLKSEISGCRERSWRLEQLEELDDMKARLLLGKVPQEIGAESLAGDAAGGGIDADALEALDTLNSELDIEMSSLMSQLGMVRGEMENLDVQRKKLLEEMEQFEAEEHEHTLRCGGGVGEKIGEEIGLGKN